MKNKNDWPSVDLPSYKKTEHIYAISICIRKFWGCRSLGHSMMSEAKILNKKLNMGKDEQSIFHGKEN